jgi:hypothetical protein
MSASAYRSLDSVLGERIAELRERRERDWLQIDVVTRVIARRVARAVGGWAGTVAAIVAFALALISWIDPPWTSTPSDMWHTREEMRTTATHVLLGGWLVALALAWIARPIARLLVAPILRRDHFVPTGHAAADLARLEAADPLRRAVRQAMRWERASAALPLVAASLLAPLSLHWIAASAMSAMGGESLKASDYGQWIGISVVIVGHAHLVLAIFCTLWAFRLRVVSTDEIRSGVRKGWASALGWTTAASCIPGLILVAIPPLLVVLTGIVFIPAMFHVMARTVERERLALETAAA